MYAVTRYKVPYSISKHQAPFWLKLNARWGSYNSSVLPLVSDLRREDKCMDNNSILYLQTAHPWKTKCFREIKPSLVFIFLINKIKVLDQITAEVPFKCKHSMILWFWILLDSRGKKFTSISPAVPLTQTALTKPENSSRISAGKTVNEAEQRDCM